MVVKRQFAVVNKARSSTFSSTTTYNAKYGTYLSSAGEYAHVDAVVHTCGPDSYSATVRKKKIAYLPRADPLDGQRLLSGSAEVPQVVLHRAGERVARRTPIPPTATSVAVDKHLRTARTDEAD